MSRRVLQRPNNYNNNNNNNNKKNATVNTSNNRRILLKRPDEESNTTEMEVVVGKKKRIIEKENPEIAKLRKELEDLKNHKMNRGLNAVPLEKRSVEDQDDDDDKPKKKNKVVVLTWYEKLREKFQTWYEEQKNQDVIYNINMQQLNPQDYNEYIELFKYITIPGYNLTRLEYVSFVVIIVSFILWLWQLIYFIYGIYSGNHNDQQSASNFSAILGSIDLFICLFVRTNNQFVQYQLWYSDYYKSLHIERRLYGMGMLYLVLHGVIELVMGEQTFTYALNQDFSGLLAWCFLFLFLFWYVLLDNLKTTAYVVYNRCLWVIFIVMLVFSCAHSTLCLVLLMIWCGWYILDMIRNLYQHSETFLKTQVFSLTKVETGLLELKVDVFYPLSAIPAVKKYLKEQQQKHTNTRTNGKKINEEDDLSSVEDMNNDFSMFTPGQYCWLRINELSFWEFHPFYLVDVISQETNLDNQRETLIQSRLTFHIRIHQRWTRDLNDLLEIANDNDDVDNNNTTTIPKQNLLLPELTINVYGPNGFSTLTQPIQDYNVVLFFSAGIGSTSVQYSLNEWLSKHDFNNNQLFYMKYWWSIRENYDLLYNLHPPLSFNQCKHLHFVPNVLDWEAIDIMKQKLNLLSETDPQQENEYKFKLNFHITKPRVLHSVQFLSRVDPDNDNPNYESAQPHVKYWFGGNGIHLHNAIYNALIWALKKQENKIAIVANVPLV